MLDFVLMCIIQQAVHNSPKRQEYIHKNLYPFTKLISKGEGVWEFPLDWFIDMFAFILVKALRVFLHDKVVNHPFFFFLGTLIINEPSISIWVVSNVVTIFKSFSMSITIIISSHIWCINLVILFENFATLNLPLSQLATTLTLGLQPRQRDCKVASQGGSLEVASHAPGNAKSAKNAKSVREWTLTLSSELPLWELEFQMDSRIFRMPLQGSKPIGSKSSLYHWKAIET